MVDSFDIVGGLVGVL